MWKLVKQDDLFFTDVHISICCLIFLHKGLLLLLIVQMILSKHEHIAKDLSSIRFIEWILLTFALLFQFIKRTILLLLYSVFVWHSIYIVGKSQIPLNVCSRMLLLLLNSPNTSLQIKLSSNVNAMRILVVPYILAYFQINVAIKN